MSKKGLMIPMNPEKLDAKAWRQEIKNVVELVEDAQALQNVWKILVRETPQVKAAVNDRFYSAS